MSRKTEKYVATDIAGWRIHAFGAIPVATGESRLSLWLKSKSQVGCRCA